MVSVIIPTYNRAGYLQEALDSVLRQTYRNFEIIVADDGSTDGTAELLRHNRDSRIVHLRLPHGGKPSISRNRGIERAVGKYICFLDSDDLLDPKSMALRVKLLDENPQVGLVCSHWLNFSGTFSQQNLRPSYVLEHRYLENVPECMIARKKESHTILKQSFCYEIFYSSIIKTSSVMVRRDLLAKAGGFDESLTIGEDWDLWVRLAQLQPVAYLHEPLAYTRIHESNMSSDMFANFRQDTVIIERLLPKVPSPPVPLKARFFHRIADFYFDSGWHFLQQGDVCEAKARFARAAVYRPFHLKNLLYCLLLRLPWKMVGRLWQRERTHATEGTTM